MYIPNRSIPIAATLLLLSAACTPQLVRDDETKTSADGSYSGETISSIGNTVVPPATASQNPTLSPPGESLPEDAQQPLSTPADKPKPPVISAAQKMKAKPVVKVAAQPKAKKIEASLSAGTKPASQKDSSKKISLPSTSEPVQSDSSLDEPERKGSAAQPPDKPIPEPESADNITDAAEAPESSDDHQQLVMLNRPKLPPEEVQSDIPSQAITTMNLAALPLSFGAHWSLDRRPNPINHETQCLLASRSINISDGYERTDVQLLLTATSLYVKTDSNIDLSYPDSGIRLDDGTQLQFESLAKQTAAMISGDVAALYKQMTPSQTLLVRLGFWPTWPVTQTQEASFPLDGFSDAVNALWLCEKM